jgi:glutathione S-transferase
MTATLYALTLSHPSRTARGMLEYKDVDYRLVDLVPAMHAPALRALGFSGYTVPALKLDGRRIQGSLEISRELERLVPDPPLYPADPDLRRRVEEAEIWGEAELQGVARRLARWSARKRLHVRRWMSREVVHVPLPDVFAVVNTPVAVLFARASGATDEAVRADMANLHETLDRVDGLVADGTIGGDQPNAADFQVLSTIRALLTFEDTRDAVEQHPSAAAARRVFPDWAQPWPSALPEEWRPSRR